MAAAFIDECGPVPGRPVQLQPMRRSLLDQLCRSIAHPLLPFAVLQAAPVIAQARDDLGHAARAAQVGAEPRQAVIDDVRMRVIESRQHRSPFELDDPRTRAAQTHHFVTAGCDHDPAGDGKVAVSGKTGAPQRPHNATGKDQISVHAEPKVRKWPT